MNNEQLMAEQNCILKVLTGSRLYGTFNRDSDYDIRGIFLPDEEYIFGLKKIERVKFEEQKEDYELIEFRKFVKLAMDNNPNILELLFIPEKNILKINNYGIDLLTRRKKFLHQGLINKFLAYSKSQKHKMYIKKENLKILEEILKFLRYKKNNFKFLYEIDHANIKNKMNFIQIADLNFKKTIKISKTIQMIEDRLKKLSERTKTGNKIYDTKFAMHSIRLLFECYDFVKFGEIKFPFVGEDLKCLLDIKNGKWEMEDVIEYSEILKKSIEDLIPNTKLPKNGNYNMIENYAIMTMKFWYKQKIKINKKYERKCVSSK